MTDITLNSAMGDAAPVQPASRPNLDKGFNPLTLIIFMGVMAAGLLFVALQVAIFATASYFVIGIRGGSWEPGVFLAIPLVVCFFSYLYAVSVFFGVLTRSTLAARFSGTK